MPAPPPQTKFYEDDDNAELWRGISRLYDDFNPQNTKQREQRFATVLNDMLTTLGDAATDSINHA